MVYLVERLLAGDVCQGAFWTLKEEIDLAPKGYAPHLEVPRSLTDSPPRERRVLKLVALEHTS